MQLAARLSGYAPGERMQRHAHDCHQVSLLLVGTLGEKASHGEVRLAMPAVGVKPAGLAHANDYGPAGALMLGVDLPAGFDLQARLGLASGWQWRERPSASLLMRSRLLVSDLQAGLVKGGEIDSRLWELLAGMADAGERPRGVPPRWVIESCQRLQEEALPLTALAQEVGVHPVYFARAFNRWMGCMPSVFRARAQLQRALPLLAVGESLATVAQQAGFADQAHFSRTARAYSGLPPLRLRSLLRG